MSTIWIKGWSYDTTKSNLDCSNAKYNGSKTTWGKGDSYGGSGDAVPLKDAPGYPNFRVADRQNNSNYKVRIDYYTGAYNIGWYPESVLPTAYVKINFDNGVGERTYTWNGDSGNCGNFPSTSKTGYTHTGWKIGSTTYATTQAVANSWVSSNRASGTMTAVAQWTPNSYTVSYNANGGSGAPSNQTKYYGTNLTLTTAKPTRTGYTFVEWNTKADGTGTNYASGGSYTANEGTTLYAVWQSNVTCTITYDANGGADAPASQSGYAGTSLALSSTKPTKSATTASVTMTYDAVETGATLSKYTDTVTKTTSYTFSKWTTNSDGSGTSYTPGQTITLSASMTLYAQYTSTTTGSVTLPTGTLDQFTLQGFSKSTSDISIVADPYSPNGSETLYAIWAVNGLGGMLKFTGSLNAQAGDKIRLANVKGYDNEGIYTIASISEDDGVTTIYFDEDFPESVTQDASEMALDIYSEGTYVPDLDFICAKDNRLWGCNSARRTIYASALGDPEQFEQFEGTADDSYQLAVATPGDFTGCVELTNCVVFSKQHYIHKMLGSYPAEYAMYTYNIDGVSYTNGGSLRNCGGIAMYVGEHGIFTYNGSNQSIMSLELGENEFQNAKGCYNGEKYIMSAIDKNGSPKCYEYDTRYGIWIQKEYGAEVTGAAHLRDQDYVLLNNGTILNTNTGLALEGEWAIVFRPFIESISGSYNSKSSIFQKKRYNHLWFRLDLPYGSRFQAYIENEWGDGMEVCNITGDENYSVREFPIWTPRNDTIALMIGGQGRCRILGIQREFITGSARDYRE